MRQLKNTLLVIVLGALALPTIAAAAPPSILPIQGYLTNSSDLPLDGTFSVKFELFDAATVGTSLYSTTIAALSVSDGYFTVYLGDAGQTALDLAKFRDEDIVWLEISVGAETMTPRLQVGSVAFAAAASYCGDSESLGGLAPTAYQSRVTGTCTNAQKIIGINANGTAMCATDVDTTYTNGAGLALAGTAFSLAAGGVGTGNIADGAVTGVKLAANAVASGNIVDGTIAAADLAANSVASGNIVDGTIASADLAANSVSNTQMTDNAIGSAEIVNDSIAAIDLAPDSVTASELAADSVGASELAVDSVGASELAADSVGASEIAADSVGVSELNIPALYAASSVAIVVGQNYIFPIIDMAVPVGSNCLVWSAARVSIPSDPGSSYIYPAYNASGNATMGGYASYLSLSQNSGIYQGSTNGSIATSGAVDFGCMFQSNVAGSMVCKVSVVCF